MAEPPLIKLSPPGLHKYIEVALFGLRYPCLAVTKSETGTEGGKKLATKSRLEWGKVLISQSHGNQEK